MSKQGARTGNPIEDLPETGTFAYKELTGSPAGPARRAAPASASNASSSASASSSLSVAVPPADGSINATPDHAVDDLAASTANMSITGKIWNGIKSAGNLAAKGAVVLHDNMFPAGPPGAVLVSKEGERPRIAATPRGLVDAGVVDPNAESTLSPANQERLERAQAAVTTVLEKAHDTMFPAGPPTVIPGQIGQQKILRLGLTPRATPGSPGPDGTLLGGSAPSEDALSQFDIGKDHELLDPAASGNVQRSATGRSASGYDSDHSDEERGFHSAAPAASSRGRPAPGRGGKRSDVL
jgi:hypothetical protein